MLRSPWPDEGYQCNISQYFFNCKYVEINNSNEYSLETFLVCIKVIDTSVWHAKFNLTTARIISIWLIFTVRLINSLRPSDAYMRRQSKSLVPIMACRLVGAKPLPATLMVYCQLDSWEQVSVKFELVFYHLHSRKCIRMCRLPKWRPFCPGELTFIHHLL